MVKRLTATRRMSGSVLLVVAFASGAGLYLGTRADQPGIGSGSVAAEPSEDLFARIASLEAAQGGRVTPFDGPIPGEIVLLYQDGADASSLPRIVSGEGVETTVRRVASMDALRAAVGPDTIALVIHVSAVAEVDWSWVQSRFAEGRMVIGANINMGDLLALLGPASASVTGQDGLGWEAGEEGRFSSDRKFFSLILGGAARCAAGSTHEWDEGFSSALDAAIRTNVSCVPLEFTPA